MSHQAPSHSFPWRVTALVVLVVVAVTVVVGLLLGRDRVAPAPEASPAASAAPSPSPSASALPLEETRQLTVLLTVRDADRAAVLLGFGGGTGYVAELFLPRDLLLPTVPPRRLETVDDPTGADTAEQPIETLLGVQVDALVDLDRLAWGGLIDATGSRVDPEAAQDPGAFGLALDRVLKGLPYDDQTAGQVLTGLGSMARTTVTNEDAGYLLARLGRNLRKLPVERRTLPVTYLRSGPERVAVADLAATEEIVAELFPQARLEPGHPGQPRLVLEPAGATLGALTAARLELVGADFGVVVDRPSAAPVPRTRVLVPAGAPAAQSAGEAAAAALGLPASVVEDVADGTVDVRVILGSDVGVPAS